MQDHTKGDNAMESQSYLTCQVLLWGMLGAIYVAFILLVVLGMIAVSKEDCE